ncbi:hypothetical protein EMIHUDRAFT_222710 [Emiliania huxleyi CCMP1516]|uniref:Uncharacterized protein n=2 Tax=Emiliania huxleyi TaxID=2903 RepID=A0A0D3KXV6_EMIH1|nr:hypothetical protein EMIHUDRAFT_222710 [Emiliania huxleyi CCMP1516]EOD40591.1 hypothetical protein EMIHUDRAFT_222710 [Emiliania huxleyi CCMP1516]|eukprot:XP_005793020.1 hypothetical protein EMIHUDRAFT_222710 [Emiliania huxleyi CCMP1516]
MPPPVRDFAKARGEGASPRGEGWAQGTGDLSRIGYALGDRECDDRELREFFFRLCSCQAAEEKEAARHAEELLAEVEAEKRAKGKKGKKKKKGGGSGGAGPSQESEAPAEAAAAKPAPLDREGLLRLLAELHEDRIRFGITAETSAREAA